MTRVLIVDDEAKLVSVLSEFLGSLGFEVFATGTGEEALRFAEQHPPHVVLLDMTLDGSLSGLDVLERLKARFPKTVVLIVSGYTEQSWKDRALQKGAHRYFEKPLQVADVLEAVQQAVQDLAL